MVNNIFPKKDIDDMTDDVYETYCCMVWGCNSMNAVEGMCRRYKSDDILAPVRVVKDAEQMLYRAQSIIWFLLEESGRYERYIKWDKEMGENKNIKENS